MFILLFLIFISSINFAQSAKETETKELNLVFSKSFFEHVNKTDARASIEIWARDYANGWERKTGQKAKHNLIILNETISIKDVLNSSMPSLMNISTIEYLNNDLDKKFSPYGVGVSGSSVYEEIILLSRIDTGIDSLNDLEGRSLTLVGGTIGEIADLWLENIIFEEFGKSYKNVLNGSKMLEKASQAILSVYFKKFDICAVNKYSYEILCELNPQVKKEMKIIIQSDEYLPALAVFVNSNDKEFEEFVINTAMTFADKTYNQQMLKLFRVEKVVPFKNEYLKNIKELLRVHKNLVNVENNN